MRFFFYVLSCGATMILLLRRTLRPQQSLVQIRQRRHVLGNSMLVAVVDVYATFSPERTVRHLFLCLETRK
jgi:hypothetical protein